MPWAQGTLHCVSCFVERAEQECACSKINYLDPRYGFLLDESSPFTHDYLRITVAWCKKHSVPVEKLFTKALLTKCEHDRPFSVPAMLTQMQSHGLWRSMPSGSFECVGINIFNYHIAWFIDTVVVVVVCFLGRSFHIAVSRLVAVSIISTLLSYILYIYSLVGM